MVQKRMEKDPKNVWGDLMIELTHLSLFSGIGGADLAAEWAGFTTVGQCECADYPTKVLEKHWPNVPRWKDIRTLTKESFYEKTGLRTVTLISGGFPCQPHSLAGKHKASNDERDLWGELFRVFCDIGAEWLVAENVYGLLSSENGRFFGRVLRDLANVGCNAWWYCFSSKATGTLFEGKRIAIVASPNSIGRGRMVENQEIKPDGKYLEMLGKWKTRQDNILSYPKRIKPSASSGIKRNDDGVPDALDRLKCLGNAIVPQQFYPIFKAIADIETGNII